LQVFAARDCNGTQRFGDQRYHLAVKQGEAATPGNSALFFDYLLQLARVMIQVINHALPFLRL
jgi:hypothetical protein